MANTNLSGGVARAASAATCDRCDPNNLPTRVSEPPVDPCPNGLYDDRKELWYCCAGIVNNHETGDDLKQMAFSIRQQLRLEARVNELTELFYSVRSERDKLLHQVNKLIESCYYRTNAGKVHWKQGQHFGTSTADNTTPEAFEQAMAAIRRNAGIDELEFGGTAQELTCANCGEASTNPGQFVYDGRWVCSAQCKRELCDAQSYEDLAASGGIVNAP